MNFFQRRMQWLEAVTADIHEWLPVAIAVKLSVRYLNNESQCAWPGVGRLARELHTDRRNVQRAIDRLVGAGWLARSRGRRGESNRYRITSGLRPPSMVRTSGL